jgi:hypothetical protein
VERALLWHLELELALFVSFRVIDPREMVARASRFGGDAATSQWISRMVGLRYDRFQATETKERGSPA